MDFFAEQDKARGRTRWLVFYFILALLATGAGIYAVYKGVEVNFLDPKASYWNPRDFGTVVGGTAIVVVLGSMMKLAMLRGGGAVVAHDLGGRPIDASTSDFHEKQVLNVVEEMAIASGIPAPQVWVMDGEAGINAFAAGTEPGNAVIGVTHGTLKRLTRSELQGVVAHEFSHILNGDMKLNMRLMGWIFGIIMIGLLGRGMMRVMYYSGRQSRQREGVNIGLVLMIAGLGLVLVGSIGEFCARMIQAAISRQREFLADASAVQFTRDPSGLAGALRKIGGLSSGSKLQSSMAGEASHMFFSASGLFNWGLATHPPLDTRIKKLQSDWDGSFEEPKITREPARRSSGPAKSASSTEQKDDFFRTISAGVAMSSLGRSETQDLSKGQQVHGVLKRSWLDAVHDRAGAQTVVYGLLMAQEERTYQAGQVYLRKVLGDHAAELAEVWRSELEGLHSAYKIALIDVALPTLRRLTPEEYELFIETTEWLIASDTRVNVFEFMLQRMVARHLRGSFEARRELSLKYRSLEECGSHALVVISTMAGVSGNEEARRAAYASAMSSYAEITGDSPAQLEPHECGLDQLAIALAECERAAAVVKKQLVHCCGQAVMADHTLTNKEAEVLRSIADAIGVPVPPFVTFPS